ncbi:hypothetical protein D3C75_493270 [compost metagenome]
MATGMQGINADLRVHVGRSTNIDNINVVFIRQHLLVTGVNAGIGQAVARFFLVGLFRVDIHQGNNPAALTKL